MKNRAMIEKCDGQFVFKDDGCREFTGDDLAENAGLFHSASPISQTCWTATHVGLPNQAAVNFIKARPPEISNAGEIDEVSGSHNGYLRRMGIIGDNILMYYSSRGNN